jgi:hypothetical protein
MKSREYAFAKRALKLLDAVGKTDWGVRVVAEIPEPPSRETCRDCGSQAKTLGLCWPKGKILFLSSAQMRDDARTRETIYHEVAHAMTPGDAHGLAFEAALARVRKLDASDE